MLAIVVLMLGCNNSTVADFDRCNLDLVALEPGSAAPGETVIARGGPFIDERDTAVLVGGERALVVEANGGSDACIECLVCRIDALCSVCDETCTGLDGELDPARFNECFTNDGFCDRCEFSIEFVVPDVAPGFQDVWAVGQIGTSPPIQLNVTLSGPDPIAP